MKKAKIKPIYEGAEWTFASIQKIFDAIQTIAVDELKLETYPNQIDIITSEQMLDVYSSVGMPLMYNHWSFGKDFIQNDHLYKRGNMSLAYELVINSSPTINYLMEDNSMTMQALVLAHAGFGHNSFFKNNYLFKQWTDATGILDYMSYGKEYIKQCEDKYGLYRVEKILDACHALMNHAVDKYERPKPLDAEAERLFAKERAEARQQDYNVLWNTLPDKVKEASAKSKKKFLEEPEENLLFFIEKYSPILEDWEREIVRIVRNIAQYFYPQGQTKVMNEGWACFTHYYIMNRLWEKGQITEGAYLEFIRSHTAVCFQPTYNETRLVYRDGVPIGRLPIYSGINPYALGFDMFMDIKRICEAPTEEDKEWFPDIAGSDWLKTLTWAYQSFRDESFCLQFLSPTMIRKWKLFHVNDPGESASHMHIEKIHNERGYKHIRKALSNYLDIHNRMPNIAIKDVDLKGNRVLKLDHYMSANKVPLDEETVDDVLEYVYKLWGHKVELTSILPNGKYEDIYEAGGVD